MQPKEYLEKVKRFDRDNYDEVEKRLTSKNLELLHAILGMSGEAGEVLDTFKKSVMYGKPVDINNLKEECGDILWYMGVMLRSIDSSFEEVMQMNYDKLNKRYPEGFTETHAVLRLDKK